ncbi:WD repeat-containing protein 4 [Coelomomyces lativittatus]|nr:WD repeat-containing protein 4 [Coelomomyces lativittatus]
MVFLNDPPLFPSEVEDPLSSLLEKTPCSSLTDKKGIKEQTNKVSSSPVITLFIPSHRLPLITIVSGDQFLVYHLKDHSTVFTSFLHHPIQGLTTPLSTLQAGCFSLNDDYLILSDDQKGIYCFETTTWTCLSKRTAEKRIMQICPTDDGFIVADKHGDVYSYPFLDDPEKGTGHGTYLLGHVSMVTCATWSKLGYVITGDRDEKIRVSHYPYGYHIETYCLGHTQFVSQVQLDPKCPTQLISAGGDPFLCRWDWKKGQLIRTIALHEENDQDTREVKVTPLCVRSLTCMDDYIAVVIESRTSVLLYQHDVFQRPLELHHVVFYICFDNEQTLWIGTAGGCFKYHVHTHTLRGVHLPPFMSSFTVPLPPPTSSSSSILQQVFVYESLRKLPKEDEEPTFTFLTRIASKNQPKKKKTTPTPTTSLT